MDWKGYESDDAIIEVLFCHIFGDLGISTEGCRFHVEISQTEITLMEVNCYMVCTLLGEI